MKINRPLMTCGIMAVLITSCSAPKDVTYFQDIVPGQEIPVMSETPITLEPNDKVQILVSTSDPRLNALFNLPVASTRMSGSTTSADASSSATNGEVAPYTINKAGNINFPVLGQLHIAGMTRDELAEYIRRELISRDLAKNPIVTVEYLNLAVSVMGAVNRPGRYGISREDFTIIDALSAAGDLTIYGRRDNIKVIRKENGVQKAYYIDLSSGKNVSQSPVYFLRQGDVVYVEPNNTMKRNATPNGNIWSTPGIWLSLLSSAIGVTTLVLTLTK